VGIPQGQARIKVHLDQNGYGKQRDHERLRQDLAPLETKEQHRVASKAESESGCKRLTR
jgi:hypothetical protein